MTPGQFLRKSLLTLLLLAMPAPAQRLPQQPPATGDGPPGLASPTRLGLRTQAIRNATLASTTVVIVSDSRSYRAAISRWRPTLRFPVLIDAGTLESHENIARFARGYRPKTVLRWQADEPTGTTNETRRNSIERALLDSWGMGPQRSINDLYAFWSGKDQFAPGVVVANTTDPAWTAALALASFRAQPIVWTQSPSSINATLSREQADAIAASIESALDNLPFAWRNLGDQIDALTLCLNTSAKYQHEKGEIRALTDRLGRHAIDQRGEARWAWASQIFGDESRAAYNAMSALFLSPTSAWLFDGYENKPPYSTYELASLAPMLKDADIESHAYAQPRNGRDQWLIASARAIDAGLIFVNTHGMRDAFNLSPGKLRPGAVPILNVPAVAHVIHSWSAVRPGDRLTVAGRWFERGVYAYLGSVDEPYLQAFVPPSMIVARLRGAGPWAASVRIQESPVWKLACFGDPLITLAPPLARDDSPLELDGSIDLASSIPAAAGAEHFDEVFSLLSLLGRDADALRLARALLSERPEAFTPEIADASLLSVGRVGTPRDFFSIYARLDETRSHEAYRLDHLWNLLRLRINAPSAQDRPMIAYLRTHLREDQRAEDAADLAKAIARTESPTIAISFLESIEARNQRGNRAIIAAKRAILSR